MNNEFLTLKKKAINAIEIYDDACKNYSNNKPLLKKQIEKLSLPFKKGHFTLAVVGELSAGKSTFINALLDKRDILPTGKHQTTSTLTIIDHSENPFVIVTYGDGKTERIDKIDNIRERISNWVSIPEKYRRLPVNLINNYILQGLTKDDIIKGKIKEIAETSQRRVEENQILEYIESHPKNKIATQIMIGFPLSKELEGWRIIDTPGVNAIGGIEDKTYDFLYKKDENGHREADAIIFVHNGQDKTGEKELSDFVKKTYQKCNKEIRDRFFFVITNKTNLRFDETEYLNEIRDIFGEFIEEKRFYCVDSLASLLMSYIEKERKDIEYENIRRGIPNTPQNWTDDEWNGCKTIVRRISEKIEDENKENNNESYRVMLNKFANFTYLRGRLNEFVKEEKGRAYDDLKKAIKRALKYMIHNLEEEKKQHERYLYPKIDKQRDYETRKAQLTQAIIDLQHKLDSIEQEFVSKKRLKEAFDPIIDQLEKDIEGSDTKEDAIYAGKIAIDNFERGKNQLVKEFEEQVHDIIERQLLKSSLYIPNIDFTEIEEQATEKIPKYKIEKKPKRGFLYKLIRYITRDRFGNEDVPVNDGFDDVLNFVAFKKKIKEQIRTNRSGLQKELENHFSLTKQEIQGRLEQQKEEQQRIEEELIEQNPSIEDLQQKIKLYDERINKIKTSFNKL